jgi:cytochrome c oxidase cbb3-type subunit III
MYFEEEEKPRLKDQLLEHDADGIQEYDNDLPRWWLYGFYFTIACAVMYLYYYHAYTGPDWNFLWYNQRGAEAEYKHAVAEANTALGKSNANVVAVEYTLKTDEASLKRGSEIFNGTSNLCYTCHRADLGGVVGPNLTDEYWIHGGGLKGVVASIKSGYPEKGMMPYGSNAKLSDDDLMNLASFILSKQGSNPPSPKVIDPARDKKWVEGEEHDHASHAEGSTEAAEEKAEHPTLTNTKD